MARDTGKIKHVVLVCGGSSCKKAGGKKLLKKVRSYVEKSDLRRSTHVVRTDCNGLCDQGPLVCLMPENFWLPEATPKKTRKAIREHLTEK